MGVILESGTYYPGIWFNAAPTVTNYIFLADGATSNYNAPTGGSHYYRIANATKMRLHTSGGFVIGGTLHSTDPGSNDLLVEGQIGIGIDPTHKLHLSEGTTAAAGIAEGDCELYRSAANTWYTPDGFSIDGAVILGLALRLKTYTDATRPAANTLPAGSLIYNTDDTAPNYSDGTDWRDAMGTVT
jgi:hypothetical protein